MIDNSTFKKYSDQSKRNKITSPFLRKLIFSVVEKTLRNHYGSGYSERCLQSSVSIRKLLEKFDIKSKEYCGAVCVSQAFDDEHKRPSWNGFWDNNHHVFLVTEFCEVVDLTINALHLHPMSNQDAQAPVPSVWWNTPEQWPHIMRYLPEGPIKIDLPPEDEEDLNQLLSKLLSEFEKTIRESDVEDVFFDPILHDMNSLNELYENGNAWVKKSLWLQEANIPHPPWIAMRENQLMREYISRRKI